MFADFAGNMLERSEDHPDRQAGGKFYKIYILWLTFPPMIMLFLGQPVYLILAYGVLGALFMPFMSVTLLWILNTDRVPREWRNGLFTNIMLLLCTLAFGALALDQLRGAIMKAFGG